MKEYLDLRGGEGGIYDNNIETQSCISQSFRPSSSSAV